MAKCRCGSNPRIVSSVVQSMGNNGRCRDVCANPICGEPDMLGTCAPVIYDAIGINLCTSFDVGAEIATEYPTAVSASIRLIDATYSYGDENVNIEALSNRPNCYRITLSNITALFAMNLYDSAGRLLDTLYPTAVYLPSSTTDPTYDEDTNPNSVELDIYAPYGLSYDTTGATPTPVIPFIGFNAAGNTVIQGITLNGMAKLLDFDTDDSSVSVGLTLCLQSIYFAGYKLATSGKINVPKGSIVAPEDTECIRFVAGDLLNLAIKPLELGEPLYEERYKQECCGTDSGGCNTCSPCNTCNTVDDTTVIIEAPAEEAGT
ncbi:MAG: hypothetical protein IJ747_05570 [Lachnospiraceae bacterium]|nr:hypothetical protein [Lachnospiraceae bacterium]